MRVIVLLSSLNTGGAEFSTLSFYGWLRRKDYAIKVVCYKKALVEFDPKKFGIDDIITLPADNFLKKRKALSEIVRDFQPDLIHSVLFEANMLGRFTRFAFPRVVHLESLVNEVYSHHRLRDRNVNFFKLKGYQLLDFITQIRGVDHYHANGHAVAKHYRQKLRIEKKRITVVHRGRDKNPFVGNEEVRKSLRQSLGISLDKVVLINVGRQEFQKGQDTLVRALKILRDEQDFVCLIVGREGNFTGEITQAIAADNLHDRVKLLGHRDDVKELLAACDIFVFPSRFEGFPGVMIEAAAASLPIVCSAIENNREAARENYNCLFFPVDDAKALAAAMGILIRNSKKRKEMATNSLAFFNENFDLEKIHRQMKELLDSLIINK
jgi:glycosyltransferase involved in cell wall biosynthesis